MKTISINGFEVPEPLREAPEYATAYWTIDYHEAAFPVQWSNRVGERKWLADGICHLTREAAKAHSEALLSFTRVKCDDAEVNQLPYACMSKARSNVFPLPPAKKSFGVM